MNLFFRLIRIIIHALYRPKLHFLDRSIVTFRVWPFDLDINSHMTNSRYLSVMDLGRTDLLIRTGLGKLTWKKKWASVLGSATIRWRRSLKLFQKFDLHTHVVGWDNKWFYLDQKIVCDGHVVAHAIMKAIFVKKGGSIMASELVTMLTNDKEISQSPPLPKAILHWNKSEEAMRQEAHVFSADYFKETKD